MHNGHAVCFMGLRVNDSTVAKIILTASGTQTQGRQTMPDKYILIVDDDPDLVETIAMMLENKGYEVGKASDGVEGEEAIKKRQPDVLIPDVMMPRKDGYKLCEELKTNKWTQDIPVVLLTAVGDAVPSTTYSHADGLATQADEYIPKPVDPDNLVQTVEGFFL